MYLVKITVEKIAEFWPLIKQAVSESLPPIEAQSEEVMTDVLQQLLAGTMQAWVGHKSKEYPAQTVGIMTTVIIHNPITNIKNLLIYSIYSWSEIPEEIYVRGLVTLKEYAKAEGCKQIHFYTANPQVLRITEKVGFDTSYTFGVIDLNLV